ncbi:MAG: thioredoxin family protein [Burkholderiales bacterium]
MNQHNLRISIKAGLVAGLLAITTWANALELKPFSQSELSAVQQQGRPVIVHFHADWCSTCVAQAKSLEALKADPQLKAVTVLVADYDKEKELRKSMKIRSQSVMVVFKGPQEVTRLAGQSQASDIKAAFLKAL